MAGMAKGRSSVTHRFKTDRLIATSELEREKRSRARTATFFYPLMGSKNSYAGPFPSQLLRMFFCIDAILS
jgi:hypothetical protein